MLFLPSPRRSPQSPRKSPSSPSFFEPKCIFPKCYPKCIFLKCTRLACLLSFASLFLHTMLPTSSFDQLPSLDEFCAQHVGNLACGFCIPYSCFYYKKPIGPESNYNSRNTNISEVAFLVRSLGLSLRTTRIEFKLFPRVQFQQFP